ncbi:MAG: hypothetical protein KAG84_00615 [Bacteroidales bacterium]|nr:hypothetical protein [Bacteroidales bacterium]
MSKTHSFHIPVLGIGYSIDSPLKVSKFGINSVLSLVDDILVERVRKVYSSKYKIPYQEISDKIDDFRAKRITSYLNFINKVTEEKITELRSGASDKLDEIKEYFSYLPDSSTVKKEFNTFVNQKKTDFEEFKTWLSENVNMGSIDVNIMTKIDKDNYKNGEQLPVEYNDAHAALRGYAESDLESSIILSAGMNPRLFNYMENFRDFFPDVYGRIKKKIVLKVSDYRSALIQGKYLAKKGIWVSEYRIESGLNCGGHAFATDGYLLGPVLNEFKIKRDELIASVGSTLMSTLVAKGLVIPKEVPNLKITAQGGVGTSEEHQFLIDEYNVDSVGWGTPFLMVPEATSIDDDTLMRLAGAKEEDLYLSDISPLGVPFNSLRGNTKDVEKMARIAKGTPGSPCPKKYVALNNDFTEKSICTASRRYQKLAIKKLVDQELPIDEYQIKYEKIVEKSCICVGLSTATLKVNNLDTKIEGDGVSVCPGPNMAYYSKTVSLKQMIGHIYGEHNIMTRTDRPNMFVKELGLYLDFLRNKISDSKVGFNKRQAKYLNTFVTNLQSGIDYYYDLFNGVSSDFETKRQEIIDQLVDKNKQLEELINMVSKLKIEPVPVKA